MKVAVLILAVLVAGSSAGLFDASLSIAFATSNLTKFANSFAVEITAIFNVILNGAITIIAIVVQVGQNFVALIVSFGVAGAELLIIVTADAVEMAAYIAIELVGNTIASAVSGPYNAVATAISAQVNADIAGLTLLVISGKVSNKYRQIKSSN